MANPKIAVVAAALCIALASTWTTLLRNSPIDPANTDLPHPPQTLGVFAHNKRLQNPHKFGSGIIPSPEDLVFDSEGRLYTGCGDGWIKRISFLDNLDVLVENWTYVGGRPLGLAFGIYGELLVCEASQGLLNLTEGHVEILTNEVDGLEFRSTDGVDVSIEGEVYFTDATDKYGLHDFLLDILELRPHGRLLKYEASTKTTSVLLKDLYFPNGVALSAKQDFLVFCETSLFLRVRNGCDSANYWISLKSKDLPIMPYPYATKLREGGEHPRGSAIYAGRSKHILRYGLRDDD